MLRKNVAIGLYRYLSISRNWILQPVLSHKNSKKLVSVRKKAQKFLTILALNLGIDDKNNAKATESAKKIKKLARTSVQIKNRIKKPNRKQKNIRSWGARNWKGRQRNFFLAKNKFWSKLWNIEHLGSGYPILELEEYMKRTDKMGQYLN